ncbi:MAG: hypothetical protein M9955_15455 [Rhizobiaceae bacterium]|nr:hypothetical protein [Rhizobiaceae bacterium]
MSENKRLIILPFRKMRGHLQPDQAVRAETRESAVRRAKLMAARYAGVATLEYRYDDVTGESFDVSIVHQLGEVPALDSLR